MTPIDPPPPWPGVASPGVICGAVMAVPLMPARRPFAAPMAAPAQSLTRSAGSIATVSTSRSWASVRAKSGATDNWYSRSPVAMASSTSLVPRPLSSAVLSAHCWRSATPVNAST